MAETMSRWRQVTSRSWKKGKWIFDFRISWLNTTPSQVWLKWRCFRLLILSCDIGHLCCCIQLTWGKVATGVMEYNSKEISLREKVFPDSRVEEGTTDPNLMEASLSFLLHPPNPPTRGTQTIVSSVHSSQYSQASGLQLAFTAC